MRTRLLTLCLLASVCARAQFKNDNISYKTVDPEALCDALRENKGYLLLDVRSPGEYADTSGSAGYNLGHFREAVNINVRDLGKRINEISDYRNKPVFVYCSHSQRSRRASKMLADSGFTKVFNINGGVTSFYYRDLDEKDCMKTLFGSVNKYNIISFQELGAMMKSGNVFVVDVRPDSAFRHITNDAKVNAYGTFKGSINIPYADLHKRLSEIPKSTRIVITDIFGDEAAKAAAMLSKEGYEGVSVLIEGVDRLLFTNQKDRRFPEYYIPAASYDMITASEFKQMVASGKNMTMLDIRSVEEFSNMHKESWRNIGHINNATHIPAGELQAKLSTLDPNKTVLVYGIGSGTEVHTAAELLQKSGFKDVKVLVGGLFNLRWTSGNVKGEEALAKLVVDVPEINQ